MTFNGAVSLDCDWTSDRRLLHAAIDGVEAGGATALHDAAYAALMLRDPSPGRPLVLVFSDAADTAVLGCQARGSSNSSNAMMR